MAGETTTPENKGEVPAGTAAEGTPATVPEDTAAPTVAPEGAAAAAPAAGDGKPAASAKPWATARIDELTAEKYEKDRLIAEREAEIARLQALVDAGQKDTKPPPTDEEINRRAQKLAQEQNFQNSVQQVYNQGKEKYTDFDAQMQVYREMGGISIPFMEAAMETGEAPKILYELSKRPDEAFRLLRLQGAKQGIALAQFLTGLEKSPKISRAGAPIDTVVGGRSRAAEDLSDENLSMSEWVRLRNKQKEKARA